MTTWEENELMTKVGPGTPVGNLLRRYWQIVGAVSDLEKDPVQPVRLLGEDLTLFRNERGEFGLLAERCAHRGISLAYGIPEENGLRCAYHGWTYDTEGQVVDMPFEPMCIPFRITSYPVQELAGLLFAYLGPSPAPLVPRYDLFVRNDLDKEFHVTPLDCNWLQCIDNSMDPAHFEHLHGHYGNYVNKKLGRPPALLPARHVKIDFEVFEYGIMKRRLLEGDDPETNDDWNVGHPLLFPNILAQGDAKRMTFGMRVPVDDTHTVSMSYSGRPPKPGASPSKTLRVSHSSPYESDGSIVADIVPKQDWLAWIAQGPISDRTREHLVTSDKGIVLYHKLLMREAEKVARGEDPMGVIRDPAKNVCIDIRREQVTLAAYRPPGGATQPVG